jgi:hypothetical protein
MESEIERDIRLGRFAAMLLAQPEYVELLLAAHNTVVAEWMRAESVEGREQCYAKVQAVGLINGLIRHWEDLGKARALQAELDMGTSAP